MNAALHPMSRLLLWRLALSGGEWLSQLKPKPDTKHRSALRGAGLITEKKRKPESGGPATTFLELTEEGWNWLNIHAAEPMVLNPRATTAPTLEALVMKLGAYLEANQSSLADFLYPTPATTGPTETIELPTDLPRLIEKTYGHLSSGRSGVRVRLADLREALPEVPRDRLDTALLDLANRGIISLYPLDNPLEIQPRDREAILRTPAGDPRHILYMGGQPS
jgi:hypothetical protein